MATITSSFYRDANRIPIWTDGIITKRTITFAGATANAWGDEAGTLDGGALYTVTGLVFVKLIAVCTTSLDSAGGGTLSVGITGLTTLFLPSETATQIDAGQIWANDAGNGTSIIIGAEGAATGNLPEYAINGINIILSTATADIESGILDFYCIWRPISTDGSIVATTT
ncbi:MAG: hypothetical protein A2W11_00715 [Ignavibacteria bacterium RBG_16_35_7]|nr:MAG: hypothetical protein A2W11_00715 [Ignavibacteria bacterium RBG_16_35_7]